MQEEFYIKKNFFPFSSKLSIMYLMIAKLTGTVDEIFLDSLILDVSSVGYLVYTSNTTLTTVRGGSEIRLYIYQAIRENANDLFGFLTLEEKDFFQLLLSVSGVGPKSALGILNAAPLRTLQEGIASGDPSHLTTVSGIGKKSAEKIVVTLKDKLGEAGVTYAGGNSGEALEALTSLGYSSAHAREALQKLDMSLPTEELVKEALRQLH
jgi:Holliday junction DNA helicase RuvA